MTTEAVYEVLRPQQQQQEDPPPLPKPKKLVAATFTLLGVGLLVPWNAFISAKNYFQQRACSSGSGGNLELWFGLVYTTSSALSLGFLIVSQYVRDSKWCQKRPQRQEEEEPNTTTTTFTTDGTILNNDDDDEEEAEDEEPPYWSVVIPLSVYLLVFIATATFVLIPTVPYFVPLTLVGLSACGSMVGIASAGIVAIANLFPTHLSVGPHFQGQAMGGVAVSVVNFAVAYFGNQQNSDADNNSCPAPRGQQQQQQRQQDPSVSSSWSTQMVATGGETTESASTSSSCTPYEKTDWGTFVYFLSGCLLLIACIVGFTYIHQTQTRHGPGYFNDDNDDDDDEEENEEDLCENGQPQDEEPIMEMEVASGSSANNINNNTDNGHQATTTTTTTTTTLTAVVWSKVWAPWLAVYLNFVVTLTLFPAWTSTLQSVRRCESDWRIFNDLFVPLTFVLYNVSDWTGRWLASSSSLALSSSSTPNLSFKLILLAVGRSVFFVLFYLLPTTTTTTTTGANHSSLVLSSDIVSIGVQILFGASNGFLLSLAFLHAPTLLPPTIDMQERGSEFLNFAINFGLLSGSLSSFAYSNIATGQW